MKRPAYYRWVGNVYPMSIGYAFWPRLRSA